MDTQFIYYSELIIYVLYINHSKKCFFGTYFETLPFNKMRFYQNQNFFIISLSRNFWYSANSTSPDDAGWWTIFDDFLHIRSHWYLKVGQKLSLFPIGFPNFIRIIFQIRHVHLQCCSGQPVTKGYWFEGFSQFCDKNFVSDQGDVDLHWWIVSMRW